MKPDYFHKIKESLNNIGYNDINCVIKNNNGNYIQLKFSNSDANVMVYEKVGNNTVVNGRASDEEKKFLKDLIDKLKSDEIEISSLNKTIVNLINSKKEDYYYDFKQQWYSKEKNSNLLHDILCLVNNPGNETAYIIIGVTDDYKVKGADKGKKSNDIQDFLKKISFSGGHIPNVHLETVYYLSYKLDVIVIEPDKNVPYYLEEKYNNIMPYHVYSRVKDTNVAVDKNANYDIVEQLWKYHFSK